ncbi:MAG: tetratricopeptide repeat protein [Armatimonadota bacterium]
MKTVVIISAALALALSSLIAPHTSAGGDVLTEVLGGTAQLAGDMAYEQADVYFHGGGTSCHGEHEEAPETVSDLPLSAFIHYLDGEMAPKEHRHLAGAEEKELLPWFVTAVELNPQLVDAWCNGAYWFYRTGNHKKAEEFITQGITKNLRDYHVWLERGVLYHRLGRWRESAGDLERAEKLWKNDSEDAVYFRRAIRTYLRDSKLRSATASK